MMNLSALEPLMRYRQWIVWKLEQIPGIVKPQKIPYDVKTGMRASTTDASTWADYQTVAATIGTGQYSGIGFIFTADDPFVFIDLDGCRDPGSIGTVNEWTPEAIDVANLFSGSAMELSQSGMGLHIICSADKSGLINRVKRWNGWIECYRDKRFIAFGGGDWTGNASTDMTGQLQIWLPLAPDGTGDDDTVISFGRDPAWAGPDDDDELIRRMMVHREPDADTIAQVGQQLQLNPGDMFLKKRFDDLTRDRVPFEWLWNADSRLGQFFPPDNGNARADGRNFDWSVADQALLNRLSFWTGRDWLRMQRLFERSALCQRDKWRLRPYYRNKTIGGAVRWPREVYKGKRADHYEQTRKEIRARNDKLASSFDMPDDYNSPILTVDEMLEQLIYISGSTSVVHRTIGVIYDSDVKAGKEFAASRTEESTGKIDKETGLEKTKTVVHFTQWFNHPKRKARHGLSWLPNGPEIIPSINNPGQIDHNSWKGFLVPKYAEWFRDNPLEREKWLEAWHVHLAFLIPVASDRERFEQWIAHALQRPEELPHTAYLMFTETHGIGRNWFASVLCEVMRGYVLPNIELSRLLDSGFNSQLSRKLMVVVDEVKEGAENRERFRRENQIRQVITSTTRQINEKHVKERTEHARVRWLFFSNHADALPFDNNDRRIWVIENPSRKASEEYYSYLFKMLDSVEFISAVFAHLMWNVDISDFKAGEHAPMNEAKLKAIASMQSPLQTLLKEYAETWVDDAIIAGSMIRHHMQLEFGTDLSTVHPKTLSSYLRGAGFVLMPKKIKIGQTSENIYMVNVKKLSISDFYDVENSTWKDQATYNLRNALSKFEDYRREAD